MSTLLTLPRELQIEILEYLSFDDQMLTSQTCTVLQNILHQTKALARTRYLTRSVAPHRFHRLVDWGNDQSFGGIFCNAIGGVITRYAFTAGFNEGFLDAPCQKGEIAAGEKASEEESEEDEDTVVVAIGHSVFRLETENISTSRVLDEPYILSKEDPPPSIEGSVKCLLNVEGVEGRSDITWNTELEFKGDIAIRDLTAALLKMVQPKVEELGLPPSMTTENIIMFQQHGVNSWYLTVWVCKIAPALRRLVWCPPAEGDLFEVYMRVEK
ncbi:hypothetical protein ABW20_dc0101965 [Dactylellina cionopaga]|nr:hypothetical protein ABW20_dc0101965 [Dactylellina cionopaga]